MSTTSLTPAAAERAAANKLAQAKPNGQPNGTPGQFAALMLLQADDEQTTALTDTTAQAQADGADTKADATEKEAPVDAAQQALQSLLDWRGLVGGSQAPAPSVSDAPAKEINLDGIGMARADQALAEVKTALVSVEAKPGLASAETKPGLAATDSQATKALGNGAPEKAGIPLTDASAWKAPSPNDTDTKAALTKVAEAVPSDAARPTQPATAVAQAVSEPAAPASAGKTRPGSGKATASTARVGSAASSEASMTSSTNATSAGKVPEPLGHIRSTLDLVNRVAVTEPPPPASAAERAGALEASAVTGPQAADAPSGESVQQAEFKPDLQPTAEPAPPAEPFAEVFQNHMEDVGAQISYWTAQGAQRASFTIGTADDGPVEVKMTLSDGELAVSFETDEESVREVLQNGAQEALQRLMDAQGISLGQVSVGGGRTNTPQDNSTAERPTLDLARRGRGLAGVASEAPSPALPRVPNIMTATKLDFYA